MITDIQIMKIKNEVMRILHVPGNYTGGILEMAIVADYHMSVEELNEITKKVANGLKHQNEIFRNVRLNLIKWVSDAEIIKEVSSLTKLQMGRAYDDYEKCKFQQFSQKEDGSVKTLDELFRQLKLFYARSKLIIVLTDGAYRIEDECKVTEYLNPFLKRKIIIVNRGEIIKNYV